MITLILTNASILINKYSRQNYLGYGRCVNSGFVVVKSEPQHHELTNASTVVDVLAVF